MFIYTANNRNGPKNLLGGFMMDPRGTAGWQTVPTGYWMTVPKIFLGLGFMCEHVGIHLNSALYCFYPGASE
jgi:hypothetical protein